MKVTRLYTGSNGQSFFEEGEFFLSTADIGRISSAISAKDTTGQGHITRSASTGKREY